MKFKHATHFRLRKPISSPFLLELLPTSCREMQMPLTAIYLPITLFSLPLSLALSKTEGVRDHLIYFVSYPTKKNNILGKLGGSQAPKSWGYQIHI